MRQEVELTGINNVGLEDKQKRKYEIVVSKTNISIIDDKDKCLISFAPFYNGGSLWLSDFCDIIMDSDEQEQVISNVSVSEIIKWKKDSEKLQKIRKAQRLIQEVEE